MRTSLIAALVAVALLPAGAAGQIPIVTDGPVRLAITGRLQPQFNTSTADSTYSTFEQRRMRVGVEATIDEWIEGKLEANFAHGIRLEDAWVNLGFHPAFEVRVGQFKKPFSRIELISSSRIVPIEPGLRIRGLAPIAEHYRLLDSNGYVGRETGAQVHGRVGPLGYAAGVFNGTGQNERDDNDAKSFAGRLVLKPFAAPFEIGAGGSWRDIERVDSLGDTSTDEGLAIGVDAQWGGFRYAGPSVVLEVMKSENFLARDPMIGGQGIVSWFVPLRAGRVEGVEPLFRGSYGDPSTDFDGNSGILLTPGINLYFHDRNRFMLNLDYYMPELEAVDPEHAIRAQLQLYF